jgi:hypothetical protein
MIWLLLTGLALAGEVDLEDLDHWRTGSDAMLAGPEGCWRFAGQGRVTLAVYTPATMFSRSESHDYVTRGTFAGILRDGVWEDMVYVERDESGEPVPSDAPRSRWAMPFQPRPVFGERVKPEDLDESEPAADDAAMTLTDGAVDTANVVDRIIASIDPSITTAYAQWDAGKTQVEFVQNLPLSERARSKEITLRTVFPEGERASSLDVIFPRRIDVKDLVAEDDKLPFRMVLMDTQAHLRAARTESMVLPGAETVSAVLGALGFTIGWEQRMTYSEARQCTAEELSSPGDDEPERSASSSRRR